MCLIKGAFVGKKEFWSYQDARYNDINLYDISWYIQYQQKEWVNLINEFTSLFTYVYWQTFA